MIKVYYLTDSDFIKSSFGQLPPISDYAYVATINTNELETAWTTLQNVDISWKDNLLVIDCVPRADGRGNRSAVTGDLFVTEDGEAHVPLMAGFATYAQAQLQRATNAVEVYEELLAKEQALADKCATLGNPREAAKVIKRKVSEYKIKLGLARIELKQYYI